jgi:dipeptidase E
MCELGWKSLGVLELTALPSIDISAPGSREDAGQLPGQRRKWAAGMPQPAYLIDDQTAVKVTDGAVEVVSEGHWQLFTP